MEFNGTSIDDIFNEKERLIYDLPDALKKIADMIIQEDTKVVSFDVFDTLLVRPVLRPKDIFELVGKNCGYKGRFRYIREQAEVRARKNKPFLYDDVTLDEIYYEFKEMTHDDDETVLRLKKEELSVEKELLRVRSGGKVLFDIALAYGKEVIITSDIYLSAKFIEEVLVKNGIKGYSNLYVSSEYRLSKGSGRLFEKIIADYSIKDIGKEAILHIGDNMRADVKMPQGLGMSAVIFASCSSVMRSKNPLKPLYGMSIEHDSYDTLITGTLANWLFEDLYPHNIESLSGGKASNLGAVLYGPILILYVKWVIESCINKGIKKLIFVQRDGFLIKILFDYLLPIYGCDIETDKIYLSRAIREPFFSEETCGLMESLITYGFSETMTVREFAEKRVHARTEEEIDKVVCIFIKHGYVSGEDCIGNRNNYLFFLNELDELYKDFSKNIKLTTLRYCKSIISPTEKTALVDVGYRGSVGHFLKEYIGIETETFQLMSNSSMNKENIQKYHINSFIEYSAGVLSNNRILHPLTEDIISIQEGTAQAICEEGHGFRIIKGERSHSCVIEQLQNGIISYARYTIEVLGEYIKTIDFDSTLYFEWLCRNLIEPKRIDGDIIRSLRFIDSRFISSNERDIYADWYNNKFGIRHSEKKQPKPVTNNNVQLEPWERISSVHLTAIKICEIFHVLPFAIATKRFIKDPRGKKANDAIVRRVFEEQYERFIESLKQFKEGVDDELVVVMGTMASFDKGTCRFINCLEQRDSDRWLVISEAKPGNIEKKFTSDYIIVPEFLLKEKYQKNTKIKCNRQIKEYVHNVSYLEYAFKNLTKRHTDMEEDYAFYMALYFEKIAKAICDTLKPKCLLLWNEFYAFRHVMRSVAEERGITNYFMEFGVIPGTISIDSYGTMGNAYPTVCSKEFIELPITENDYVWAEKVIEYCKKSGLNRNVQPQNNEIDRIKGLINSNRPTVFYAGVNDYESGLYPYSDEVKKAHSPYARSSLEGVQILSEIAAHNNWNLIYKPHPRVKVFEGAYKLPENVIEVDDVNINDLIDICDVTVTILSAVAYSVLIREKPLVLMGFIQLKEKGCAYEAYKKEDLESVIKDALENGYTTTQKNSFIKHTAQLLKYDLYNDLNVKAFPYGRTIEDAYIYLKNGRIMNEQVINET